MKTFIKHDFPTLKRIDSEAGRTYKTPTGKAYPSVTAVTSLHSAKAIQEWRNRVGHAEANKISSRASKRGTAIHSLCENYLLGNDSTPSMADTEMFRSMVPVLDQMDNIHCLETPLFSHHLQVAGTVDCIAEYQGKLHIIDFKTSGRIKSHDHIHGYFMQTSAYAVMFEEMTGIPVGRLLIVMGVDNEDVQVFQEKRNTWIDGFIAMRDEYRQVKGI